MTTASLLQVIAQEAATGFALAGLADCSHLYMAIRKNI